MCSGCGRHATGPPGVGPRARGRAAAVSGDVPALRLRGVGKRFGYRWALRDVSLELGRGSVLTLRGPNGAGKTTLLKILAGLYRPSAGGGEVLGAPLGGDTGPVRQRTVLLPATDFLYEDLTGTENLRFASLMAGDGGGPDRWRSALERAGLVRAADDPVRSYSSGMRKRLSLARVLLRPAGLVLLDEPYGGLDREGARFVDRVVEEIRDGGRSAVLATHRGGEAARRADRVAYLRAGRVEEGAP